VPLRWRHPRHNGPVFALLRADLRFRSREIILDCFQKGRMSQWARAHFFVGRENSVSAGLPVEDSLKCGRMVVGLDTGS
jgi:hypothetical protein